MTSPIRYLATLFKFSIKSVLIVFLVLSLLLNVAILTVSGVQAVMSGVFSAVGIGTVAVSEVTERAARKKATRKISRSISGRVIKRAERSAVRNSASVFGESIPFLGVAVIVGALALEIKDSCDTARDISALAAVIEADGNPEAAMAKAEEEFDCRELIGDAIEVPTTDKVWAVIRQSPSTAWNGAQEFYDDLPDVSFSGSYEWLLEAGQSLLVRAGLMDEVAR